MSFLESALLHAADAIQAVWGGLQTGALWIGWLLESILNPLLSPLLSILNAGTTAAGDAVYALLDPFPPWVGLALISAVSGVVMLLAFRYLSNQPAIGRAKDDIKANLLALKLYKDDLRVTFKSQGRILWALARLQRYILVPVLWMALPMMLVLAQMGVRYQWRPLRPGERTLLKVAASNGVERIASAALKLPEGIAAEIGPVAGANDVAWRIRAERPGRYACVIECGRTSIEKEIVVGDPIQRVSPVRPSGRWTDQLLYPNERVIKGGEIERVEVAYPQLKSWVYGSNYWVVAFFIISMATALILKPLFKVRF